ncbi:hypothetical protein [Allocoleopsis franciscana]|uniref:Uncharacterized protein n=1 Tax=Allocoleopsis franciscana PCC 7113 TaxID=1173027 RepID=K9WHM2_9CYAN|nr:hypothetical protein [Allocoleopsis franciscana]AFZ19017.1 hypothetical protein Mic7113_3281 [Allocoleopsis franciscana PCC 7113]
MLEFQVLGVAGLVGKRFELDRIVTTEEAHVLLMTYRCCVFEITFLEFRRSHLGSDPILV